MNVLSIKIRIANREYPMTIDPAHERVVRESAYRINQAVKQYQKNFGTYDYQSLLSMAVLGIVADLLKENGGIVTTYRTLTEQVKSIQALATLAQ